MITVLTVVCGIYLLCSFSLVALNCKLRNTIKEMSEYDSRRVEELSRLRKIKDIQDDLCETLQRDLSSAQRVLEQGCCNLIAKDEMNGKVFVYGQVPGISHRVYVTCFPYDMNDAEDRDFALREAEELIEIIRQA